MTKTLCEFGLTFGTCCGTTKEGWSMDTEKLHIVQIKVIYDKEEYFMCKGCIVHFDYDDYREDTEAYDIKSGKDVTHELDWNGYYSRVPVTQ